MSRFLQELKEKARNLKASLLALWFAYRHPRTPWYAKLWAAVIMGYGFSPIDLIPDFIPLLGYLDDLILLPAGIWLAIRMIPTDVWLDSQEKARMWFESNKGKPKNWTFAALIVLCWTMLLIVILYIILQHFVLS
jgi:uncharacterized membrane protein YkvA (DUF1232 family)